MQDGRARILWRGWAKVLAVALLVAGWFTGGSIAGEPTWPISAATDARLADEPGQGAGKTIDFERARGLMQKRQRGEGLSEEEEAYLRLAIEARRRREGGGAPKDPPRMSIGRAPLTDMGPDDRYKGEDGGLYGGGRNGPPEGHRRAAEAALAKIRPLDAGGEPGPDGRVVLVSISMSNATQEFSEFKRIADADRAKSPCLTIVDCAQGGQAMAEWASPDARPWHEAMRRIQAAGVTGAQVQVAWIKLANKAPRGDLEEHGRILQRDALAVIQNAKARFPNLRVVYLASRIYGGYAAGNLNPEPYAYESGFVVRWLIEDQIRGDTSLAFDPSKGPVRAPVLLWGPYLWADGTRPRAGDGLVWAREDLAGDGTHPSPLGRAKVAKLLLEFFKTDPLATSWFLGNGASP